MAVLEALEWHEVGIQSVQKFSKVFDLDQLEAPIDNPNPGSKIEDYCTAIKKDYCTSINCLIYGGPQIYPN